MEARFWRLEIAHHGGEGSAHAAPAPSTKGGFEITADSGRLQWIMAGGKLFNLGYSLGKPLNRGVGAKGTTVAKVP